MKARELIQNITAYLVIAWLFFMVFYFNYVVQAAWYSDMQAEFQKLSLVFAYMVAFYVFCALFVAAFLNTYMCNRFSVLSALSGHWPKIDFVLKIMVLVLSLAGLVHVTPGHPNA